VVGVASWRRRWRFHVDARRFARLSPKRIGFSQIPILPSPPSTLVLAVLEKFGAKVPHDLLALAHLPEPPPTSPPPEGVRPLLLLSQRETTLFPFANCIPLRI